MKLINNFRKQEEAVIQIQIDIPTTLQRIQSSNQCEVLLGLQNLLNIYFNGVDTSRLIAFLPQCSVFQDYQIKRLLFSFTQEIKFQQSIHSQMMLNTLAQDLKSTNQYVQYLAMKNIIQLDVDGQFTTLVVNINDKYLFKRLLILQGIKQLSTQNLIQYNLLFQNFQINTNQQLSVDYITNALQHQETIHNLYQYCLIELLDKSQLQQLNQNLYIQVVQKYLNQINSLSLSSLLIIISIIIKNYQIDIYFVEQIVQQLIIFCSSKFNSINNQAYKGIISISQIYPSLVIKYQNSFILQQNATFNSTLNKLKILQNITNSYYQDQLEQQFYNYIIFLKHINLYQSIQSTCIEQQVYDNLFLTLQKLIIYYQDNLQNFDRQFFSIFMSKIQVSVQNDIFDFYFSLNLNLICKLLAFMLQKKDSYTQNLSGFLQYYLKSILSIIVGKSLYNLITETILDFIIVAISLIPEFLLPVIQFFSNYRLDQYKLQKFILLYSTLLSNRQLYIDSYLAFKLNLQPHLDLDKLKLQLESLVSFIERKFSFSIENIELDIEKQNNSIQHSNLYLISHSVIGIQRKEFIQQSNNIRTIQSQVQQLNQNVEEFFNDIEESNSYEYYSESEN